MKKKWISMILSAAMVATVLVGCGGDGQPAAESPTQPAAN